MVKHTIKKNKLNKNKYTNKKIGGNPNIDIEIRYKNLDITEDENYLDIIENDDDCLEVQFKSLTEFNDFFDTDEGKEITILYLNDIDLEELPSNISGLTKLTHLDISGNSLDNELNELQNLHNLKSLYISSNQITNKRLFSPIEKNIISLLPELPNLKILVLQGNDISNLDNISTKFPNLELLDLSDNNLTPLDITKLQFCQNLEKLEVRNNSIEEIISNPDIKFLNLELLDLSKNELTKLDITKLQSCPNLEKLDVRNNQIDEIISNLNIIFPKLELLNLSDNIINELNVTKLKFCPNLKELEVKNNYIDEIISNPNITFPNLRLLDLSKNKLTTFDLTTLQFCPDLKLLELNKNEELNRITGNFDNLIHLEIIGLRKTNITTIPDISKLMKLETIDLQNTNVYYLPVPVIKSQLRSIIDENENKISVKYNNLYFYNLIYKQFYSIGINIYTIDILKEKILDILEIDDTVIFHNILNYENDYQNIELNINQNDTIQIENEETIKKQILVPYVPTDYQYQYQDISQYIGKEIDEAIKLATDNIDICNKKALEKLKNQGTLKKVPENYNPLNYIKVDSYIGKKVNDAKILAMRNSDNCNMKYLNNLKTYELKEDIQDTIEKIEINIGEYLSKSIDNIIILYTNNGEQDYIITQKSKIIKMYTDLTHLFYPCLYHDTAIYPRNKNLIHSDIYLDLKSVSEGSEFFEGVSSFFCNVDAIINSDLEEQTFALIQNLNYYSGFTSLDVLVNQNAVSGWHCQEGTAGSTSQIIKVNQITNKPTTNINLNTIHLQYYKFKNEFYVFPNYKNMISNCVYHDYKGNYYKGISYSLKKKEEEKDEEEEKKQDKILEIYDIKNYNILNEFYEIEDIKNMKQILLDTSFNLKYNLSQNIEEEIKNDNDKLSQIFKILSSINTTGVGGNKKSKKTNKKNRLKIKKYKTTKHK